MITLEEVRARFARDQGLPFADALTEASILDALNEHGVKYRDRLFSPATTIWGFLSQVLSEDHSCRDTVSRIIAHRAASGLEACSPHTALSGTFSIICTFTYLHIHITDPCAERFRCRRRQPLTTRP
jgi:hypothetical protein